MGLLERDQHLDGLEQLLAMAARGQGRMAVLTGDAGIGKTALTLALAERAGDGRVFRGACEDLSVAAPLGALHDLAREAGWDLEHALARHDQPLPVFSEALEMLGRAGRTTLVIIEDLHWADDATIDLVRFLGRRLQDRHILILVTARSDTEEARARLRRALADVPPDNLVRIALDPLSHAAVERLARANGMDGGSVFEVTAGNPFFVTEMLRDGRIAKVPPSVEDAVLARADRLGGAGRKVLDSASIFSRQVEAEILETLAGAEFETGLEECIAAGLLERAEAGFHFRHDLARRAIEFALSDPARRRLNTWALDTLRAQTNCPTAQLLHHAREAGDTDTLRLLAPVAAREAARVGAYREAAQHFATALAHLSSYPPADRATLCRDAAVSFQFVGRNAEAIGAQSAANELYRVAGDRLSEGDGLRRLSRFSYSGGDRIAAEAHALRAAEMLAGSAGPELAMAWSNLSQLAMLARHSDETRRWGEKAIELAGTLGRDDIACHALNNMGTQAYYDGEPDRGRQLLDRSLAIALQLGLPEDAARAHANRACNECDMLDHPQAWHAFEAGIPFCLEHGIDYMRLYMQGWKAQLLMREGRWAEAETEAEAVIERVDGIGHFWYPAALVLARLQTRRGTLAEPMLARLRSYLERGAELQRFAPYAAIMAERAWLGVADRQEALALLDEALAMAQDPRTIPEVTFWRRLLDPQSVPPSGRAPLPAPWRLLFASDWLAASEAWAAIPGPYEQALALLQGGPEHQRQALDLVTRLGADAVADHIRDLMRSSGIRAGTRGPRATTRANAAGLTKRQMDVLRLLGEGHSNSEIAERLFVASKTVDHHVSAILEKLNVSSRGAATAEARRNGLL